MPGKPTGTPQLLPSVPPSQNPNHRCRPYPSDALELRLVLCESIESPQATHGVTRPWSVVSDLSSVTFGN